MGAPDRSVSHHLAALSAEPGHAAGSQTRGKSPRWEAPTPPKRDPRFRLSSRDDGAGLTMRRPSRRPTVTRNGRASIVAWFPQTPQPDAHHIHYRIRRLSLRAMIVTRLGPGCDPGSSVRPSLACSPSHHQVQPLRSPPIPASAPILERLLPATRLLFLAGMHHGAPSASVPSWAGLCF